MYNLGHSYARGDGVEMNWATAAEWLERDRARLVGAGLACTTLEFDGGHELPPEVLAGLVGAAQA